MATIKKRAWKTAKGEAREAWVCRYADSAGMWRLKTFTTKRQADNWLVQTRHQVAQGTHTPESTSATIGEAIELWLQHAEAEGLEAETLAQYRQHRGHILAAIDGSTKLARITQARCERLRDDLLARHSRAMARKILGSVKAILKDAARRGLITHNPAAETVIGGGGRHKPKIEAGVDFPPPGDVKAMLEAADPKGRALVALAALAGLRASELRGLRWADLDLGAKPAVTVAQRADKRARIGSPKSKSSRRSVPLGEAAARALREWKLAQPPGRSLVFGTASDRPDMLENLRRRLLTPLCAKAGVPRYGWHSLRHYAVSTWLKTCRGDFKRVQHWAGHATLALTLDTYGHLIKDADDHARIADAEALLGA